MLLSPTALESHRHPIISQDLLKAQTAIDYEKQMNQIHPASSSRNNAQLIDHKSNSIQNKTFDQSHNDDKKITQLFDHLHRPLPKYFRPRQLNTTEWFCSQSNDILFDK